MSKLNCNLHALAICYRTLGGIAGLVLPFLTILMFGGILLSGGSASLAGMAVALPLLLIGGTMVFTVFEVASSLQHHESPYGLPGGCVAGLCPLPTRNRARRLHRN